MSDEDFDSLLADLEGSVKIVADPISFEETITLNEPDWKDLLLDVPSPPPSPSPPTPSPTPPPPALSPVPSSPKTKKPASFPNSPKAGSFKTGSPKAAPKKTSKPVTGSSAGKSIFYKIEGEREHKVQSEVILVLTARDEREEFIPVDHDKIDASLEGPMKCRGKVIPASTGRYKLAFTPGVLGQYHLHVDVDGKPLFKDNSIAIEVVENFKTSTENISFHMEGKGLKGGKVGETATFTIKVEDSSGHPRAINSQDISIVIGLSSNKFNGSVVQTSPGKYLASFRTQTPGTYSIDVMYKGKSVLKSPGEAIFSADADPSQSTCTNIPTRVPPRDTQSFSVQAKNNLGLNNKIGGDPFTVEVAGPVQAQNLQVLDHNNGTYTIKFVLPERGKYSFSVMLHGRHIRGSPFDVEA